MKAGLSATSQSRWGDYTGIDNDAALSNPAQSVAWYAGQWTKGTNTFGTWVRKLTFTYGQVFGSITDDCDGSAATTGDRTPIAGVSVALKQGLTTIATTTTNALGQYSFGYLESGTYDVVPTPPAGGSNVDATAGTGATTQTRISASDVQIVMTNAQSSSANNFVVATNKPLPATTSIVPSTRSAGDPQFTLTRGIVAKAKAGGDLTGTSSIDHTIEHDDQLTAVITAVDQSAGASKTITVFTPSPGGGTSNGQTLTINGTPDTTPPTVTRVSPADGSRPAAGSTHNITWTATDNVPNQDLNTALSTDGGASWRAARLGDDLGRFAFRPFSGRFTPEKAGEVTVMARAINRIGETQTEELIPNPAGYHHNLVPRIRLVAA